MPFSADNDRTIIEPGATLKVPLQKTTPCLVVLYPAEMRDTIPLKNGFWVGRSPDADLTLDDDWISRKHCVFHVNPPVIEVEDLGSTNGTFIDGAQIERANLSLNSRLQLGQVVMKVEYKDLSEMRYDEEILQAATKDALTGIANRSWFVKHAESIIVECEQNKEEFSVAMLDVDFFKKVNDTYGHQAGDFVLREIAHLFEEGFASAGFAGRFGGEEFVAILKGLGSRKSKKLLDQIRKSIEKHTFLFENQQIPITVSMGFSVRSKKENYGLDEWIRRADEALYKAKESGRNKVVEG